MKREPRYEGRVLKDLKRLDSETQRRILSALERFAATGDGDVRPLRGEFAGSYRLRVGKWRVFVRLEGTAIVAYRIDNRGEAY
jgi:mRNA-degrading endonuclease RelE of RelBE toxin-antitoxin system